MTPEYSNVQMKPPTLIENNYLFAKKDRNKEAMGKKSAKLWVVLFLTFVSKVQSKLKSAKKKNIRKKINSRYLLNFLSIWILIEINVITVFCNSNLDHEHIFSAICLELKVYLSSTQAWNWSSFFLFQVFFFSKSNKIISMFYDFS